MKSPETPSNQLMSPQVRYHLAIILAQSGHRDIAESMVTPLEKHSVAQLHAILLTFQEKNAQQRN